MSSISHLLLAFAAGTGIGSFYFGGLLWTVHRLVASEHPARLTLLSLLVRMSVSLGAFYWVMGGHWERLMAALLGAMVVRGVLVQCVERGAGSTEHGAMRSK